MVGRRPAPQPEATPAAGLKVGPLTLDVDGLFAFGIFLPLLFIAELGATVAELPPEVKNRHSHRARAAAQMVALMREVWR